MVSAPRRLRPHAIRLAALATVFGLAGAASGATAGPYVLGVVPSAAPVLTRTRWMPLVERLEQATGLKLTLKVYENMSDFEEDLDRGGPDFALSNPMQVVLARAAQGYEPLVRSAAPLAGVLFVNRESPIRSVDQLGGQPVAFVGAKSV